MVSVDCEMNNYRDSRQTESGIWWWGVGKTLYCRKDRCSWFTALWMTVDSMIFDNMQQLRNLLEDHRMMTPEWCFYLQATDCGRSSVHKTVHDVLSFQKLSTVPHLLIDEHIKNLIRAALSFLSACEWDGDRLIRRIIMEDETYIHYYTPTSKQQSTAWCESSQDDLLHRPNYGDCILGLKGHFTPQIPLCRCQYHSRHR